MHPAKVYRLAASTHTHYRTLCYTTDAPPNLYFGGCKTEVKARSSRAFHTGKNLIR